MNRSLKFFLQLTNKNKKNRDNKTGLSKDTTSKQVNIIQKGDDPYGKSTSDSTYNKSTTNIKSLLNDRFFINYLGNNDSNEYNPSIAIPEESDISLTSIIEWTQKNHPSMVLKPEDFVYLKAFRSYPANRLMVLRRFPGAINHDLFSNSMKPLSTMVTYIPEGEMPVKIDFNESWKSVGEDHTFLSVLQSVVGIDFSTIPGVGDLVSTGESPFAQNMINKIGQKLGFITGGGMPYGDPNIIYDASVRDVDGKGINSGLESNISVTFETTYLFQEINGVDAKAAMLDIIGNTLVMGTSPERFYITGKATTKLQRLISDFRAGNIGGLFEKIKEGITEVIKGAIKTIEDTAKDAAEAENNKDKDNDTSGLDSVLGKVNEIGSDYIRGQYFRYKWQLTGLLGTMAGVETAPWHITIGNPKAPWFTCGNLVVDSVELEPNDVLGYNDYFTELTVKIQLKQGRSMGLTGLSNLFNNGRGRIYVPEEQLKKIILPDDTVDSNTATNASDTKNKEPEQETQISTDGSEMNKIPGVNDFGLGNIDNDTNLPQT